MKGTLVELRELIRQVKTEMERGDYKMAARLCEHAAAHLPSAVTIQRLLGECRLELHDSEAATLHLQAALDVDPMSVVVHLGLGVAAERRADVGAAYAWYRRAWEINPGFDQLRDRLLALCRALGVDPPRHPTPAELASVHLRAGRFEPAISELRRLVEAEPEERWTRSALVEALWRNGDDGAAAAFCRSGLESSPENGRYLAILAEIELRTRRSPATRTLARLHSVDPLGEIATLMTEWRPDRDVLALMVDSVQIADAGSMPALLPRKRLGDSVPARAPRALPASTLAAVLDAPGEVPVSTLPPSLAVTGLDTSIQPFRWSETETSAPVSGGERPDWDDWRVPIVVDAPARATVNDSATSSVRSVATNFSGVFETSDGGLDLTAGWDDLDQALADATPSAQDDDRFAGLVAELSVEGIAPFDATVVRADESAWEPLSAGDVEPTSAPLTSPPSERVALFTAPGGAALLAETFVETTHPSDAAIDSRTLNDDDLFNTLVPFAFEESQAGREETFDERFDFSDLDGETMASFGTDSNPTRPRVHGGAPIVVFSEVFSDPSHEIEAEESPLKGTDGTELRVSKSSVSIFEVLRASKSRKVVRSSPGVPMFHVEHRPPAPNAPLSPIDRNELMTMRIRLIEEEHSAGDVATTLEARMSEGRADALAARVLGEAYLRLGKSNQAAAQFRQAMLCRSLSRTSGVGSAVR